MRFLSGERRGERVPVPPEGLEIGRGEGVDLALADPSVSSRHARFAPEAGGVRLIDLDSKNGTRVGGERVRSRLLAHGDRVRLGQVELVLEDADLAGGEVPPDEELHRPTLAPASAGRGGLRRALGPALLVAALATAAFLWWRGLFAPGGSGERGSARATPPERVPGDLLGTGSFEGQGALEGWDQGERRPLVASASSRRTGELGVGADLAPGETVLLLSREVARHPGRPLAARAHARLAPGVRASLALVLLDSAGARPPLVVHGEPLAGDGAAAFRALAAEAPALFGHDRARLAAFVHAPGGGALALDDASLVEEPRGAFAPVGGPALERDQYQLLARGEPARELALVHIDRALVLGLSVAPEPREPLGPPAGGELALRVETDETGFSAVAAGAGALSFAADLERLAAGISTKGADGRRERGPDFRAEGVEELVLGESPRLLRLVFDAPVDLRVRPVAAPGTDGEPAFLGVTAAPVDRVRVQVDFRAERASAAALADRARRAGRAGEPAAALAAWAELLRDFPFDRDLVAEAERERARLVEQGLAAAAELAREHERARAFDLPDIHRRHRARAAALAARYRGSEVEAELDALLADIDAALAAHVDPEPAQRRERLSAVAEILRGRGSEELARHVLEQRGEQAP